MACTQDVTKVVEVLPEAVVEVLSEVAVEGVPEVVPTPVNPLLSHGAKPPAVPKLVGIAHGTFATVSEVKVCQPEFSRTHVRNLTGRNA